MTIASQLQAIQNNSEIKLEDQASNFLLGPAKQALTNLLIENAKKGLNFGRVHISKRKNPRSTQSGFATLSGELNLINAEGIQGVYERNKVIWIYLNATDLSRSSFQQLISDFQNDLTATEGLTISDNVVSVSIADFKLSW